MARMDANSIRIIVQKAYQLGLPPEIPLMISFMESGIDPTNHSPWEPSTGLFQTYYQGGMGDGYSIAQLEDPETNAGIVMPAIANVFRGKGGAEWWAQLSPTQRKNALFDIHVEALIPDRDAAARNYADNWGSGVEAMKQIVSNAPSYGLSAGSSAPPQQQQGGQKGWYGQFEISSGFGNPFYMDGPYTDPVSGQYYPNFNKGYDFSMGADTPVLAFQGGVIEQVNTDIYHPSGWGAFVRVKDSQGYIHNYGHLDPGTLNHLKPGLAVPDGMYLGKVGAAGGVSTGPHLSYDVMKHTPNGTQYVDPKPWVDWFEQNVTVNHSNPTGMGIAPPASGTGPGMGYSDGKSIAGQGFGEDSNMGFGLFKDFIDWLGGDNKVKAAAAAANTPKNYLDFPITGTQTDSEIYLQLREQYFELQKKRATIPEFIGDNQYNPEFSAINTALLSIESMMATLDPTKPENSSLTLSDGSVITREQYNKLDPTAKKQVDEFLANRSAMYVNNYRTLLNDMKMTEHDLTRQTVSDNNSITSQLYEWARQNNIDINDILTAQYGLDTGYVTGKNDIAVAQHQLTNDYLSTLNDLQVAFFNLSMDRTAAENDKRLAEYNAALQRVQTQVDMGRIPFERAVADIDRILKIRDQNESRANTITQTQLELLPYATKDGKSSFTAADLGGIAQHVAGLAGMDPNSKTPLVNYPTVENWDIQKLMEGMDAKQGASTVPGLPSLKDMGYDPSAIPGLPDFMDFTDINMPEFHKPEEPPKLDKYAEPPKLSSAPDPDDYPLSSFPRFDGFTNYMNPGTYFSGMDFGGMNTPFGNAQDLAGKMGMGWMFGMASGGKVMPPRGRGRPNYRQQAPAVNTMDGRPMRNNPTYKPKRRQNVSRRDMQKGHGNFNPHVAWGSSAGMGI